MNKIRHFVSNNSKYIIKICTDMLAVIAIAIPVIILFVSPKPFKRGFYCDDNSIRYPYKDSTVSTVVCVGYSLLIGVITITAVEIINYVQKNKNIIQKSYKPGIIWQIYCQLVPFIFGALVSELITDMSKVLVGRLRPHFIDVCKPRYGSKLFTLKNPEVCDSTVKLLYITDFECTNTIYDESKQIDARLSFMSGHSSFCAFCMIYTIIYIQICAKYEKIGLIRHLYQAILIYLMLYTGYSRISDYKHHWSDVLAGLIQGAIVAILTFYFISDLFIKKFVIKSNDSSIDEIQTSTDSNVNSCGIEME